MEAFGVTRSGQPVSSANPASVGTLYLLMMPLFLISTQISTAALTYGVFQLIRGESIEIGRCLRIGFRRFFRVLLVSFGVACSRLPG